MTVPHAVVRLALTGVATLTILLLASGCESDRKWYRSQPEVAVTGRTVVAPGFLETDFEALHNWLEERFDVEYRNMTPTLIFDQLPINDIHYETINLPPEEELFELKSPNISRREILYRIARHWSLDMTIVEENGLPQKVRVEGHGDRIANHATLPPPGSADAEAAPSSE